LRICEASAAPLALAILPRLGPVGQRLPNAKAISYSIFVTLGKTFVADCGLAHRVRPPCLFGRDPVSVTLLEWSNTADSRKNPMRLSRYFLPILRETPKEAEIVSHRLMLRAGMMRQEAAGIYAFLPLGLRVLNKICDIVREEQNRSGAIELLMPTLQSAELWRESGRYDAYGKEMLRIKDRHAREMLYGPTNEEMITDIFRAYVRSYRDLPLNLYHIQWKFRDEVRPRFGLMRGREFLMKDAYSFDLDQAGARHSYNKMFVAYLRTFARMGLKAIPMVAETGPIGGNLSHEFIILASTGESEVFCHRNYLDFEVPGEGVDFDDVSGLQATVDRWTSLYAATSEMHDAAAFDALPEASRVSARGIEVGHIFYFGTKYSDPMKAVVAGPDGAEHAVHMGSYGIGPSRLVAAIIEASHDDAGIIWPESVAPFRVAILNLKQGDAATDAACEKLYAELQARGVDTLYHDLDERPGSKFATADLIGIPWQVVVGPKGLAAGQFEVKRRSEGTREMLSPDEVLNRLG
jgi:prolyl-tRNA synthetase